MSENQINELVKSKTFNFSTIKLFLDKEINESSLNEYNSLKRNYESELSLEEFKELINLTKPIKEWIKWRR